MKRIDISGKRFGRLVAIKPISIFSGDRKRVHWECKCDCGNVKTINTDSLRRGLSTSCGCYANEKLSETKTTHGHTINSSHSPTYRSWSHMIWRCKNQLNKFYGGRGISVCERWHVFSNFLEDMGDRPKGMTIDRINPNGNYGPDNCRWADFSTQIKNRRKREKRHDK